MVVGLLKDPQIAEETLNNLYEAEFNPHDISVISKDKSIAKKIGDPSGNHSHISSSHVGSHLESEGVARDIANAFQSNVDQGGILVVISGDPAGDDVAEEMLKENGGDPVVVVPS